MEKRIMKGLLSLILVAGLVLSSGFSTRVYAKKSKLKLTKTKVTVDVNKSVKVSSKKKYSKIKVKASKKGYVKTTVKGKKISIKGLKAGKVKLTVSGYNKKKKVVAKGVINVTVKKPASSEDGDKENKDESEDSEEPSDKTKAYDAGEYSITKVHSGEGTFYDRTSTGAANLDDYEKVYFTAAMNNEDYMNGLAGAYVEITDKDGDKVKVLITDRLPDGKKGDIDLSRKAFKEIEPEVTGRMKIKWKIIPLPTKDPVSFLWKPTSNQSWAEVQVRNGRYPIKSVEYYDTSSKSYKKLERQEYNYFTAPKGMGSAGPYTFRITDFYGHVITEKGISINTSGKAVSGKNNFPY